MDFNNNATEGVRDYVKVLCGYGVKNAEGQMEKECSGGRVEESAHRWTMQKIQSERDGKLHGAVTRLDH